jgi:kynureninase
MNAMYPPLPATPTLVTRQACIERDAADALGPLRAQFLLPEGQIYLDGNSLGVLPSATAARLDNVVHAEWGQGLIGSWNHAGWIHQPARVGDKIARLIGAAAGEVVAADSTSLNLYKVLSVALALAMADGRADTPQRRVIISERDNFPTDLYMAESLARQWGFELTLVEADDIAAALARQPALLMLTHVNYRTGRMHDMAAITAAAHAAGALVVWDLAHSAGAVPVDLNACNADFAVGCGYKYLNGGPGAPAFVWAHARHLARMDAEGLWQPLSGWMGHAAPFEFTQHYRPAAGIARFVCGTPSPLALAALECGVDTLLAAQPQGGMAALRAKSLALAELFIARVEARCAGHGLQLQTPREGACRGSQVSFLREDGAYAIVQALIARGVVGDYRAPGILRFGFTPLYLRYVDVWDAAEHLAQVLALGEWQQPRFQHRAAVT